MPSRPANRPAHATPWSRRHDVVVVRIRLTPKGGRDAIDGLIEMPDGPALKARVRAAPENNAANSALADLIADALDLPRRAAAVSGGHKSRTKLVALTGEATDIEARLATFVSRLTT